MKAKDHFAIPHQFAGIVEICDGIDSVGLICVRYYKNGELHNENGPALEYPDGATRWILNGKYTSKMEWKIALKK
jgi:hypothetical protein